MARKKRLSLYKLINQKLINLFFMLEKITEIKTEEKELLKMIVFFDLFNFPLTLLELKKYYRNHITLNALLIFLDNLLKIGEIQEKNGFYFLKERENIINVRRERYNYSLRKIKIARKFAKVFSYFPFVLVIYLVNSIGKYNLRNSSDIDFFIITKNKRIWLSRFFCAGLAKILHKRPNKKTKKDKICLSFYLSENNLDLSKLKLSEADPYFDYWEKNLFLLLSKDEQVNNNFLIKNNLTKNHNDTNKKEDRKNLILDFLESLSKKFQLKIMPQELLLANDSDSKGVIIKDDIIKLYLKDARLEIKKKYEQKIRQLLSAYN